MSRIILGNGKVLEGVRWSGDTCLVEYEVSAATFAGGLAGVRVEYSDDELSDNETHKLAHYERASVGDVWRWGRYYAFTLTEAEPVSEVERLRADFDYTVLMLGVDLDV